MKQLMVAIICFCSISASAQLKIGYMDYNKFVLEMPETIKAMDDIKRIGDSLNTILKNKDATIKYLISTHSVWLTQDSLESLQKDLAFYTNEYQNQLSNTYKALLDPIEKRVKKAIKAIAIAEGYQYIVDSGDKNILYAKDERYDITQKVKDMLYSWTLIQPRD